MDNYDVVIIGGGPAGLTSGLYLARGRRQVLLLGKQIFNSPIANLEMVENYPGFSDGVSGSQLIAEMVTQAMNYGLTIEEVEVKGIEKCSDGFQIACADNRVYSARFVIIASGSSRRKLGVPGENRLQDKGIFNCAFCDGGKFTGKAVAVCGGGDAGVTEGLYMTRLASSVMLLEMGPSLNACAVLKERAQDNPKLQIRCGVKVESILGDASVEGLEIINEVGQKETLKLQGILVDIGSEPNTGYLKGLVPLDETGRIIVNENMATKVEGIFAVGDIRSSSPNQISTAVGDGATAAITAEKLLQQLVST